MRMSFSVKELRHVPILFIKCSEASGDFFSVPLKSTTAVDVLYGLDGELIELI